MRALGYVRVSTQEQAHGGYGLESQGRAIRSWASSSGARLVRIERDEAVSGSSGLDERAGLTRALVALEAGEADALVVYRLDRLARDLVLQETTIQRLARKERRVISVSEADADSDDPTRVFVRQVFGALAQLERSIIRARMLEGKAAKRRRGGYVGGRPPYGFDAIGGALVPNEAETRVIGEILEARSEGLSYDAIASQLNASRTPTKSGRSWVRATVREVVKRS
jgi:DNA invertase Pin-like site-specific DNA recombinase